MVQALKIGIQGGQGSFNEEALEAIVQQQNIAQFETVYCYNTKQVLTDLQAGTINRGIFAIYNSRSEMVVETMEVLGKFKFNVISYITLPIAHQLMALPGVELKNVEVIMGHAEAIAQCRQTLQRDFSDKQAVAGSGDLMDGAAIAKALKSAQIQSNIGVIGSNTIAKYYNLQIIAQNLQDDNSNTTTFLFVDKQVIK